MITPRSAASLAPTVVAFYGRYSDLELQRSSIDDQFRTCCEHATKNGWIINQDYVCSDSGISGETLSTRRGINTLISAVEKSPPFGGIIIQDTSRLGRNLGDVLQVCALLRFHGVFLYFVNQELDSRDPNFFQLIVGYATGDQMFLTKLRHSVASAQKGRALAGMIPGSQRYGYTGEVVPDPDRRGSIARPAIKGIRMVINEEEAPAVRQIYRWALEGLSFKRIAEACIAAGFPPPAHRKGTTWSISAVCYILHNEIYRGRLIWGRTKSDKHPKTGKIVAKPVPEALWTIVDLPQLAIVSSEEWEQVQATIATHKSWGQQLGGMARRTNSEISILGGLLRCGICNQPIVTASKTARTGRILQCKRHRYERNKCTNAFSVKESALEDSIFNHVVNEVLQPEMLDYALSTFQTQLTAELQREDEENEKKRATLPSLGEEKRQLELGLTHVINSLREYGPSKALFSELSRIEGRLAVLEEQQNAVVEAPAVLAPDEARKFFQGVVAKLAGILKSNRLAAREAIRRHIGKLILTPELRDGLPAYRIKGELQLLAGSPEVMPLGTPSTTLQHYKEFHMQIDLVVPARTVMCNYLEHPSCSAPAVEGLIAQGRTIREIAKKLLTSTFIVVQVLKALDLRPKKRDYLQHPKCEASTVLRLRTEGGTFKQIAQEMGVSETVVIKVVNALIASGVSVPVPKLGRPNRRVNYLELSECPASEVASLRKQGASYAEIGRHFHISICKVQNILRALERSTGEPIEHARRRKETYNNRNVDYLEHPRCPASEVVKMRDRGLEDKQIASHFGVSKSLMSYVSRALRDPAQRFRAAWPE